jgi:hypothetical protein
MFLKQKKSDKLNASIKILLIGPLMDDIGGTSISFKHLLD